MQSADYYNSANVMRCSPSEPISIAFHEVHGRNIGLTPDGLTVTREGSFCNAVVFTNRPIRTREPFSVRLHQCTTRGWSGVLRFGYTAQCPDRLRSATLPMYVCPDMTLKPGNWAKALDESTPHDKDILTFFFDHMGNVYLSMNKNPFVFLFRGVDASRPVWGLIDVYGSTTEVTILSDYDIAIPTEQQLVALRPPIPESNTQPDSSDNPPATSSFPTRAFAGLSLESAGTDAFVGSSDIYQPLPFHEHVHGHNIIFRQEKMVAERRLDSFSGGLVFTSRPLNFGEEFSVEIVGTSNRYIGKLGVGLTACNPETLISEVLPKDSESLADRPEYWVMTKEFEVPDAGETIGFVLNSEGQFHVVGENCTSRGIVMHVDISTAPLWLFLDVYGATEALRSKGTRQHHPSIFTSTPVAPVPDGPSSNGGGCAEAVGERPVLSAITAIPSIKMADECKICMENPVDAVFYKCGHSCACLQCGVKLKNEPCPVCRAEITDVIKVFRS